MKLLLCPRCGDIVLVRRTPRSCVCGATRARYLADNNTIEQTRGSVSLALHGHELRDAVQIFAEQPEAWHPLFVFRAFLNPRCEADVRWVDEVPDEVDPAPPPPEPAEQK